MNTLLPALPATALRPARIESIDLLKGVVMVIMALDHVRDYFHQDAYFFDATDPAFTTWPLFLTRFITNFCAPAFSFLAGLSAFLVGRRKTRNELSVFLLKRGLWLIFVELVVMDFGWYFDIQFREINFQVIWSLGISMIFLAGLLHLPRIAILVFSCVIIFGHNLLDGIQVEGIFFVGLTPWPSVFPDWSRPRGSGGVFLDSVGSGYVAGVLVRPVLQSIFGGRCPAEAIQYYWAFGSGVYADNQRGKRLW